MFFGGALALLMRIQLARPNNDFLSAELYNQAFTVHGSVMMFLFAIPIFEAIAVLFLPQMLGARDLPFPRLSAFGFWCFLLGGVFLCGSIFFDAAPRGGWFMYPPLTSTYQTDIGADIWLLGFSFIEIAAIAAAVEMVVGSLKTRPPGMRINLVPLYVWYVLVAAAMIVFAFPPLITGSMLLEIERAFHWPFFNPAGGGDPLLWQHLFWLFGHPEVYIIFLPSVALIAMIVPTFARRPIVGYSWIVLAAVGVGFLSFGLWVHHMFTTGLPGITLGLVRDRVESHRSSHRHPDLLLYCDPGGGTSGALGRHALCLRQSGDLRSRRADRRDGRRGAVQFSIARHVFYRRPSSLRAHRRRALSHTRRLLLLLPARHRQNAQRQTGKDRFLARLRRLQRRVPADALDRSARHAAARLHVSCRNWF